MILIFWPLWAISQRCRPLPCFATTIASAPIGEIAFARLLFGGAEQAGNRQCIAGGGESPET